MIIGSGITAASAARTLLSLSPKLKIIVLEARELCSGATGRNGGHIKTVPYEEFADLREELGDAAAEMVTRFQMRHMDALKEVDAQMGNVGEVREVETVDLYLDREQFEEGKGKLEAWMKKDGTWSGKAWDGKEMREEVSSSFVLKRLRLRVVVEIYVNKAHLTVRCK